MPFISEDMYRNLTNEESVHLSTRLEDIAKKIKEGNYITEEQIGIRTAMNAARDIVSEGLAVRAEEGVKVRQPLLSSASISPITSESLKPLEDGFREIVEDELNVKRHEFVDQPLVGGDYVMTVGSPMSTIVATRNISDELKAEGAAREVIRYGQTLRRKAEFELDDRITVVLKTDDEALKNILESQREMIAEALQADDVVEEGDEDAGDDLNINGADVHIGVKK